MILTRPGVKKCQAQRLVFCPLLGLIQDRIVSLRQSPSNKGLEPESMVSEPESRSYGWEPESMVQEPESMV